MTRREIEDMVLRALKPYPPIYRPVKRRLLAYDSIPLATVKAQRGELSDHQPWEPRRHAETDRRAA